MPQSRKGTEDTNNDGLFDDCPVCRAMRTAAERGQGPTTEELRTAFKLAKGEGGVVGGEWFDAGGGR